MHVEKRRFLTYWGIGLLMEACLWLYRNLPDLLPQLPIRAIYDLMNGGDPDLAMHPIFALLMVGFIRIMWAFANFEYAKVILRGRYREWPAYVLGLVSLLHMVGALVAIALLVPDPPPDQGAPSTAAPSGQA